VDLDDLEAFLDTLTDADVVNQLSSAQAVPALGPSGSATPMLLLTLLAGLLGIGWWGARPVESSSPVASAALACQPLSCGRSPVQTYRPFKTRCVPTSTKPAPANAACCSASVEFSALDRGLSSGGT
jgi:hypothetical protein